MPAAYTVSTRAELPERWWGEFGDPQLTALVDAALAQNLELRAAFARIRQAGAVARQAGAARWPTLDANLQYNRSQSRPFADSDIDFGFAGFDIPETLTNSQWTASLAAAYEVDIWNKFGDRSKAAALDALAARDAAEAGAMSLVAQVAEAYFDLVLARATKRLLSQQLEINETFLELTNVRFKQGVASALDVYQQEQLVVNGRGQLALTEASIALFENQIAILCGKPPQTIRINAAEELPQLKGLPGLGIPADLVTRRPDVRAARRNVVAGDHRVAAAVADRLPGIRLQGSVSLVNGEFLQLIDRPLSSLLGALFAPIFDAGRRKAEVERNKAVVEENLAKFGQVLLTAISEVENSLVQEKQQLKQLVELRRQVELSGNALREARARYAAGLIDFLPVLNAIQSQQSSEIAVLQAQRQAVSYRLQLFRALGGTWTRELEAPRPLKLESSER